MKCPNCGKEIANGSQFCEYCGKETMVQSLSEPDQMCLNIIRVGSEYNSILASYKARKKCYKISRDLGKHYDYKEYIQQMQLDYFPKEFKKSLIGESFLKWIIWCVIGLVIFISSAIYGWSEFPYQSALLGLAIPATVLSIACVGLMIWQGMKKSKEIQEINQKD